MVRVPVRAVLLASASMTLGFSGAAFAQSAPPADTNAPPAKRVSNGEVDAADIIVTARRTEERLQDVPISITVFNQQQLTNRNVVSAQDLATYTPSLSANNNYGSLNTTFAIRGFVQDVGTAPSVGVYLADVVAPRGASPAVPIGDGAGPGSFFDLQNVQVLKGPQGMLFGRNTTGGAVLLVPQKPTSKFEGYIEGSYGNYDMKRVQAVVNIPLSDIARFRIGIDHQTRDGYIINDSGVGTDRYENANYTALRASLVVDLTPDLENYTIATYSKSDTAGSTSKLVAAPPGVAQPYALAQLALQAGKGFYHVRADNTDPFITDDRWQLINTTTWHLSDTLTLKNIISYVQLTERGNLTLFGTNFITPQGPVHFALAQNVPPYPLANQSTFTEEFQVQGKGFDDRLTYQFGGYMEISDPLGTAGNESPTFLQCSNIDTRTCNDVLGKILAAQFGLPNPINVGSINVTAGKNYFHDTGAYAQATYKFTDKLSLTGGFRYTWDKVASDNQRIAYKFNAAPFTQCSFPDTVLPDCRINLKAKSSAPTWLIDLDYKPTEDLLVYAKYSRGYRAGGLYISAPTEFRTFQPEQVDTYEGGVKATFRGAIHGNFNIAGFYNDFSNQQLALGFNPNPAIRSTSPQTSGIINAGKSRIYGVEVEAAISPFTGLKLEASYTYLNTRIEQISLPVLGPTNPYLNPGADIKVGDPLALSPQNKLNLTGTYTLPLDPGIGRIDISATYIYIGRQLTNYVDRNSTDPTVRPLSYLDPRNLLNLSVTWSNVGGLPVDLSAFATNVTNQEYYTFVSGVLAAGHEQAVLGQPRMFGARLRYSFGR